MFEQVINEISDSVILERIISNDFSNNLFSLVYSSPLNELRTRDLKDSFIGSESTFYRQLKKLFFDGLVKTDYGLVIKTDSGSELYDKLISKELINLMRVSVSELNDYLEEQIKLFFSD